MAGSEKKKLQSVDMGDSMDEETHRLVSKFRDDESLLIDDTLELVIWFRDRVGIHVTLECGGQMASAEDLFEIAVEQRQLPPDSDLIFSVWLCSPYLELRLKKNHKPFQFAQLWDELCALYTDAKAEEISRDEPVIMFQRNVFLSLEEEMRISNELTLCLLYHEAKFNVVEGRYIMSEAEYDKLAGIQALIHLEHYNPETHTIGQYNKDIHKFYPVHLRRPKPRPIFKFKNEVEVTLEERVEKEHKVISEKYRDMTIKNHLGELYRQYLEICWQYAFYGSAFFEASLQKRHGKIMSNIPLVTKEIDVLVAINTDGVCITDQLKSDPILAVPYEQLSWELDMNDEDESRLPSLLLQFLTVDPTSGENITKILHVYSRQARMMDALIDSCVKRKLQKKDRDIIPPAKKDEDSLTFRNEQFCGKVPNKLEKLTLSTYNLEGQMLETGK